MPVISVIIPAYNAENTLHETIESVFNQTFTDFELIVINDDSQDATLEVVEHLQDNRLNVFSYPHAGVSASRNRGLAKASGEFIAFLDADDLWSPDKLEAQLRALQVNPQAAVAYSWTDYIDELGKFLYSGPHISVSGNVYEKLLLGNFLENGSNALIRRETLLKVGGFDESLYGGEEWDLFLRLAAHYHFVAVPHPQVFYRMSTTASSLKISRHEAQCLKVIEQSFNQAPKSLAHLKKQSIANLYQYLTFRVLAAPLERQTGWSAARCLFQAVRNDLSTLRRSRLMLIISLKIVLAILLPPQMAQGLLKATKKPSRKVATN
ncbi:MAG TPA: glycosyltransferase [Coleofasciculaceae cyanobacterium]|jgi:glycosyltransferase involved in cell wall biosynthesis